MSDKDIKEVSNIININQDASNFYKAAQLEVKDLNVKDIFQKYETTHSNVVSDLQNYIRERGETPEADSTAMGMAQQIWGEVKAKVSNDVTESLVSSLEEAEDRCIHSIKDAIQNDNISAEARVVLKKQEDTLQQAHDMMKIMKDNAQAA